MRGAALALGCLTLLLVAQGGRGEETTVRLCGRDFVRAVVFTCGGSRWRRHLGHHPSLLGSETLQPSSRHGNADSSAHQDLGPGTDRGEAPEVGSEVEHDPPRGSRTSSAGKREAARLLTTSCCSVGCSRTDISSLC